MPLKETIIRFLNGPPNIKKLKEERDFDGLTSALIHEGGRARYDAVKALRELGDPRAVEPLISALKERDPSVRRYAACLLGEIRDGRAVEPLIRVLKDPVSMIRWETIGALVKLGDRRAIEPLIAALKDEKGHVRARAACALRRLGGPEAEKALAGYQGPYWRDPADQQDKPASLWKALLGLLGALLLVAGIVATVVLAARNDPADMRCLEVVPGQRAECWCSAVLGVSNERAWDECWKELPEKYRGWHIDWR